MAEIEGDTDRLGAYFAAARRETATLPPVLEARMLADAHRVQERVQQRVRERAPDRAPVIRFAGRLHRVLAALGGWPGLGGLTAACAAGVWLGFSPPAFLPDPLDFAVQSGMVQDLDVLGGGDLVGALTEEG
ncbi:MAG: hypothetical protein ACK5MY_14915 [Jhaorihella sp.]